MGNLSDADLKLMLNSSREKQLRDAMNDCGLDISQLASLCGVGIRTVYRWLSGTTQPPQSTYTILHLLSPMP